VAPERKASAGVVIRAGDRLLQEGNGLRYASSLAETISICILRVIVPADRQGNHHYIATVKSGSMFSPAVNPDASRRAVLLNGRRGSF